MAYIITVSHKKIDVLKLLGQAVCLPISDQINWVKNLPILTIPQLKKLAVILQAISAKYQKLEEANKQAKQIINQHYLPILQEFKKKKLPAMYKRVEKDKSSIEQQTIEDLLKRLDEV